MRADPKLQTLFESESNIRSAVADVTVVISLFNYERHIIETLGSVFTQDEAALELIVTDDFSQRDGSVDAVLAWMNKHSFRFTRCMFIRHSRNRGLAASRNTAIEMARTPLVFVMDADNTIFPSAIRRLKKVISSGDFAAVYSQLVLFGGRRGVGLADFWSKRFLTVGNYIDAMALLRKEVWQTVGGYTHIEGGWEDFDFWCKLIELDHKAAFVPQLLGRYRVHEESMLQSESPNLYETMRNELTLRHPWLDIT